MRIKTHPLTGRIQPPIMLAPEGASGGGGTVTAPEPKTAPVPAPAMGSSFSTLSSNLKGAPPAPVVEKPPVEEPPPAVPPKAAPAPDPKAKQKAEPPAKGAGSVVPDDVFKQDLTPAPPKKEDAPPPPEELNAADLTKGMSDAGRKNFEKLQTHYQGKLAKLEADLAEARKSPVTPAEIEEAKTLKADYERLKGEHAEMLKTVEVIGLERSPQFQAKYVAGRNKLVAEAARKVLNAGGSDAKFKAALELDGRAKYEAIEEALNDAPAFIANQVAAVVSQIETLDEERAQTLENAKGKLTEWGEEETARQRESNRKLVEARENRFVELIPELAKDCIFLRRLPPESPGAEEWNALVQDISERGKNFLFNADKFDDFAGAAVKAQAYDKLQTIFLKVREENAALSKQVAELTGAEPGAKGGAGGGGNGGGKAPEENMSFADRVKMGLDSNQGGG